MLFRWVSRFLFGSRNTKKPYSDRNTESPPRKKQEGKRPDLDKIGEYVEFEEVDKTQ